jgi:hypothetical protein
VATWCVYQLSEAYIPTKDDLESKRLPGLNGRDLLVACRDQLRRLLEGGDTPGAAHPESSPEPS